MIASGKFKRIFQVIRNFFRLGRDLLFLKLHALTPFQEAEDLGSRCIFCGVLIFLSFTLRLGDENRMRFERAFVKGFVPPRTISLVAA